MQTMNLPGPRRHSINWPRGVVVTLAATAIFLPLLLIFYQSFLNAPFFMPAKELGLDAYRFIFEDPDFSVAFKNALALATGLTAIAVPLGGMLAFLMIRTDLPGRSLITPMLLVPIFVSPMVMGFGYVVAMGPVGFYSLWVKDILGFIPWNIYSFTSISAGCSKISRKCCSVSTSRRLTPSPQYCTKERSTMPDSGMIMVIISQPKISAKASHFQRPSGMALERAPLPLMETNLLADLSSQRCSITSGMVTITRHTATAAIRW
jgi:hypothetical protein